MQEAAQMALKQAGNTAVSDYLQSIDGNAAALTTAATVPQAIGTPFGLFTDDLRPIQTHDSLGRRDSGSWAVAAPFEVRRSWHGKTMALM